MYRQTRVGRGGIPFNVFKVRTMHAAKPGDTNTVTTSHNSRITRTGRIFRRFKLDELPQLWNVFIGQMSFVGPRPDVPGYADKLEGTQRIILQLRPGITGPATIKYTHEEEILSAQADPQLYNDTVIYPDKVRLNLEYLSNYSLINDVCYILMTLRLIDIPPHLVLAPAIETQSRNNLDQSNNNRVLDN